MAPIARNGRRATRSRWRPALLAAILAVQISSDCAMGEHFFYGGAVSLLDGVCVFVDTQGISKGLVLFSNKTSDIVVGLPPWANGGPDGPCDGKACLPRAIKSAREARVDPAGLTPGTWALLAFDRHALVNVGHAFADVTWPLLSYLLHGPQLGYAAPPPLAGIVVPEALALCDLTSASILHSPLIGSAFGEPDATGCPAAAAFLHLAVLAHRLASEVPQSWPWPEIVPISKLPERTNGSHSELDRDAGLCAANDAELKQCFSRLVIPTDHDREFAFLPNHLALASICSLRAAAAVALRLPHLGADGDFECAVADAGGANGSLRAVRAAGRPWRALVYGREDAPRRVVRNMKELADGLAALRRVGGACGETCSSSALLPECHLFNVTRPRLSSMTFAEQAQLWSQAEVVVSPHGSHLAMAALFLPRGALVLEVGSGSHAWPVERLMLLRGVLHVGLPGGLAPVAGERDHDPQVADVNLEPGAAKTVLRAATCTTRARADGGISLGDCLGSLVPCPSNPPSEEPGEGPGEGPGVL